MIRFAIKKYIYAVVFLYFFFASVYITYPLLFHLTDIVFGRGDEMLISFILNWDIHSILTNPLNIFQAPFYHPYTNTLAYSDIFFTASIVSLVPYLILKEPIAAYNVNILFSLVTLGYFTFLLVKDITNDDPAGVVSGSLVAFSTFTLQRLPHLQVISIQWIPLCLLFLFRFLRGKSFKNLFLANLFFLLQVYNSILPGYFLAFSVAVIIFYYSIKDRKVLRSFIRQGTAVLLCVNIILLAFLTLPYFQVSREFGYVRDIRDTINFANRPEYFLYPNENTRLAPFLKEIFYKHDPGTLTYDGYFGLVFTVLVSIAAFFMVRYRKRIRNVNIRIFSAISIGAFILSLGPVLQWGGKVIKFPFLIPLPYALFYFLVPGFKGFRNSSRWEMLTVFSAAVLIGIILSQIWKRELRKKKVVFTLITCFIILAEFNFPRKYEPVETYSTIPQVYAYVRKLPAHTVILELPFYNWNMSPYAIKEYQRNYYSSLNFKKRVNGASGFSPPDWQESTLRFMYDFPDNKTIEHVKAINVTHLILHKSEYDMFKKKKYTVSGRKVRYWDEIQQNLKRYPDIKFLGSFGNDYLYEVHY